MELPPITLPLHEGPARVRVLVDADDDAYMAMVSSPSYAQHLGVPERKGRAVSSLSLGECSRVLAVTRANSADLAGLLVIESKGDFSVEVSIALRPDCCRQGLGFGAVRAVVRELLAHDTVPFVLANVDRDNVTAIRIVETLGFSKFGTTPRWEGLPYLRYIVSRAMDAEQSVAV
jgi:ribosomal protein S18 acetylase RimI-like enzyme